MKRNQIYDHHFIRSHDRPVKAQRIIRILEKYVYINKCRTIDIGCGDGEISSIIARISREHLGLDSVDERVFKDFPFIKADITKFQTKKKFDIVILKSSIEHFDLEAAFPYIDRLVKPGGFVYISVVKFYSPYDLHYHLPFLYYLPSKRLRDLYVRLSGRGAHFDIGLRSLRQLRGLFKGYTFNLEMYQAMRDKLPVLQLVPKSVLNVLCPSYVLVLQKK